MWIPDLNGSDPGVIYKLDIEKTFDHVNWDFRTVHSRAEGFWSEMIEMDRFLGKNCQILNTGEGEPVDFIPSESGLGQDDLLSPFISIIAKEGFNSMMRIAVQNRWLNGFKLGEDMEIYHFYVDIVIFCDAELNKYATSG